MIKFITFVKFKPVVMQGATFHHLEKKIVVADCIVRQTGELKRS